VPARGARPGPVHRAARAPWPTRAALRGRRRSAWARAAAPVAPAAPAATGRRRRGGPGRARTLEHPGECTGGRTVRRGSSAGRLVGRRCSSPEQDTGAHTLTAPCPTSASPSTLTFPRGRGHEAPRARSTAPVVGRGALVRRPGHDRAAGRGRPRQPRRASPPGLRGEHRGPASAEVEARRERRRAARGPRASATPEGQAPALGGPLRRKAPRPPTLAADAMHQALGQAAARARAAGRRTRAHARGDERRASDSRWPRCTAGPGPGRGHAGAVARPRERRGALVLQRQRGARRAARRPRSRPRALHARPARGVPAGVVDPWLADHAAG
jgi:hypothetical protein